MRRHVAKLASVLFWLAVGAALPALCTESDVTQAAHRRTILSRLSFEVTGGWSRAALDDLNQYSANDERWVDFGYRRSFETMKAQKGDFYSFSRIEKSGAGFTRLRSLVPAGLRVSADLGFGWTAYLGLSYLTGRVTSSYHEVYDISDLDPTKFEMENVYRLEIDYPAHQLAVKAWNPTAGIRLRIPLLRRVALWGYAAAGWLSARFTWEREYATTTTDEKGRWSRLITGASALGRGSGPSLEYGGRLAYAMSGRLTAFLEGGYVYRKTGRVDGDYASWSGREDSDSAPYEFRVAYSGGVFWTKIQTSTVFFAEALEHGEEQGSRHFRLDLSGAELRLGLAWRL